MGNRARKTALIQSQFFFKPRDSVHGYAKKLAAAAAAKYQTGKYRDWSAWRAFLDGILSKVKKRKQKAKRCG